MGLYLSDETIIALLIWGGIILPAAIQLCWAIWDMKR